MCSREIRNLHTRMEIDLKTIVFMVIVLYFVAMSGDGMAKEIFSVDSSTAVSNLFDGNSRI